jgi:hypothetical protein
MICQKAFFEVSCTMSGLLGKLRVSWDRLITGTKEDECILFFALKTNYREFA